jgi:hypothetical protein
MAEAEFSELAEAYLKRIFPDATKRDAVRRALALHLSVNPNLVMRDASGISARRLFVTTLFAGKSLHVLFEKGAKVTIWAIGEQRSEFPPTE